MKPARTRSEVAGFPAPLPPGTPALPRGWTQHGSTFYVISRRPVRWCAGPPRGWPRPGAGRRREFVCHPLCSSQVVPSAHPH
jgi:hypothetical protein